MSNRVSKRGRRFFLAAVVAFVVGVLCAATVLADGAPRQPANHAGRSGCLACHGPDKMKPVPANHAGRAESTCSACHSAP